MSFMTATLWIKGVEAGDNMIVLSLTPWQQLRRKILKTKCNVYIIDCFTFTSFHL